MYCRMYAAWSLVSTELETVMFVLQLIQGQKKIARTYHTCCLSYKKNKFRKTTYTTCKLLHKRKAQSLRKMQ